MSTSMKKALAKAKNVMHPNSRKCRAITKQTKKITHREKLKLGHAMKQNLIGEKMMWIKDNMLPDVCPYTPELTAELLQKYISRHNEELEQITIKHSIGGRKNRQHASREDIIRMSKEREETEYATCGIEIPDILNPSQCEMLRKWDGELRYLPNFKFTRFGEKNLPKEHRAAKVGAKKPRPDTKRATIEDKRNDVNKASDDGNELDSMDVE